LCFPILGRFWPERFGFETPSFSGLRDFLVGPNPHNGQTRLLVLSVCLLTLSAFCLSCAFLYATQIGGLNIPHDEVEGFLKFPSQLLCVEVHQGAAYAPG
jgi:hypothetical protein